IEFLLKQRGKEADVQEVDRALANDRPLHIITKGEALAAADDDRPRNEFSAGSNSLTEPAPIEEIKKVEAALKSLQEQSAEADRRDDLRKAKELEALIRKSNDWLKEQERLHREEKKRKGEGTDKESSRNRLKNNLADALEKLREEGMPNLAEHFDRQIKCESYAYRYSPLPSIDWSFEAPSR
ncbi:MAG TPA: hypothetical protein VFA15_08645, partial [Nitrososphaera sp.]|nr:hypothetical protein [Nitrososphaera sp.]